MHEQSKMIKELTDKLNHLTEQLILSNHNRFGRSSEKMVDHDQICFKEINGEIVFFNEAEAVCDLDAPEPTDLEIKRNAVTKAKVNAKKILMVFLLTVLTTISVKKNLPLNLVKTDGNSLRMPFQGSTVSYLQRLKSMNTT